MPVLIPMSEAQYQVWSTSSKIAYAQDKMQANGCTQEEADAIAHKSFADLLPQETKTPDHFLFSFEDNHIQVGILWLAIKKKSNSCKAFIYDILIHEKFQGQGHGRSLMQLAEKVALEKGATAIGLHVFGFNQRAINLYKSLNYQVTDLVMEKHLAI